VIPAEEDAGSEVSGREGREGGRVQRSAGGWPTSRLRSERNKLNFSKFPPLGGAGKRIRARLVFLFSFLYPSCAISLVRLTCSWDTHGQMAKVSLERVVSARTGEKRDGLLVAKVQVENLVVPWVHPPHQI